MTDEYEDNKAIENIAQQYIEHASVIKEIVMPGLERKSILTARRIALKVAQNESIVYKAASRVYNCDIPEDLCANICGLETCCKDCEVALLAKGRVNSDFNSSLFSYLALSAPTIVGTITDIARPIHKTQSRKNA